ncbi:MAG: hypothetical protein ACQETM_01175, partial [Bacteroidota bacterium]
RPGFGTHLLFEPCKGGAYGPPKPSTQPVDQQRYFETILCAPPLWVYWGFQSFRFVTLTIQVFQRIWDAVNDVVIQTFGQRRIMLLSESVMVIETP